MSVSTQTAQITDVQGDEWFLNVKTVGQDELSVHDLLLRANTFAWGDEKFIMVSKGTSHGYALNIKRINHAVRYGG